MTRKRQPPTIQVARSPAAAKPAKNKPGTQPGSDDPLALLRYDHRMMDNLFSQFTLRKDRRLAERVCANLALHLALEESFYREAETIPELHSRVEVALREHRDFAALMRTIGSLEEGEALNDQMLTLQRAVEQHMREEERAIFPAVVKGLGRHRLRELGISLRTAKDKLPDVSAGQPRPSLIPEELTDEDRAVASR